MGYRSDVMIAIEFPDETALVAFFTKVRITTYTSKWLCDWKRDGLIAYLNLEYVKWYEDFADVKFHEAIYQAACAADLPVIKYRIGEELSDTEVATNHTNADTLWDRVSLKRSIEHDLNGDKLL